MKDIKILHSSCCATNSPIKSQVEAILTANQVEAKIEELSKLEDTMQYGTMDFPSLVIDGKVVGFKSLRTTEDLAKAILG